MPPPMAPFLAPLPHNFAPRLLPAPQPYFGKLMKRKWLTSGDAFDAIVLSITSFSLRLRPLHPEPHQVRGWDP